MDKLMDAVDPEKSLVPRLGILAIDLNEQFRSLIEELRISQWGGRCRPRCRASRSRHRPQSRRCDSCLKHHAPIDSVNSLRAIIGDLKPNSPVVLQVERDGKLQWLAFEIE